MPSDATKVEILPPDIRIRTILAGRKPWTIRRVLRRLLGPFHFASLVFAGRTGIVVWINDWSDGMVVALTAVLCPSRLYFIHNNPHAIRSRPDLAARVESFLVRRCHVIVHSKWLQSQVTAERPHHVHVVAHPNYTRTSAGAPPREPEQRRVAYVGSFRLDKGSDLVLDTLLAANAQFEFRIIGRGEMASGDVGKLEERGVRYSTTGSLKDEAFLRELAKVTVVIAPYTQATESGSVLLCMALGVPVLALESPTMRRILNSESMFSSPSELGEGVSRFLETPWSTFRLTPEEQRRRCREDLEAALRCQALSR